MRVVSLGSSSTHGNAYLLGWGSTNVLIDCGVPIRRLEHHLTQLGIAPGSLAGVFVTHEHSDHVRALQLKTPFPTKYDIPLYAPRDMWATRSGSHYLSRGIAMTEGTTVKVKELEVCAYGKSHDAVQPFIFRVTAPDGSSAAVVTDLGEVTQEVFRGAQNADYLVFESNHDRQMELSSGRPYLLIQRVLGKFGHLSNDQAGAALREIVGERTRGILLAHLSIDCNTQHTAVRTVTPYLRGVGYTGRLAVAAASGITVLSEGLPSASHQAYAPLNLLDGRTGDT